MSYYIAGPYKDEVYSRVSASDGLIAMLDVTTSEAKMVKLADGETYRLLMSNCTIAQDGYYKSGVTQQDAQHLYIDLHTKPWKVKDWKAGKDTHGKDQYKELTPTKCELWLIEELQKQYLDGNAKVNSDEQPITLGDGFRGSICFGPYDDALEAWLDLPEGNPKRIAKLEKYLNVEPVELSDEFKALKEPKDWSGGSGTARRGQSETEKANERLDWVLAQLSDTDKVASLEQALLEFGTSKSAAPNKITEILMSCVG